LSALSDHITSHVDILQLVGRYVSLKKAGTNYAWLCPFHSEKSPSFLVSPTKQIYKCFWCGKGWNAINFFMEIERIDYGDAVKQLSDDYRIDLAAFESKRQSSPEYKSDKEKIKRMMKLAQEYFVRSLDPETSSGWHAYDYLRNKRKLSDALIGQLGLGYAPSQSQSLFSYFQGQGFSVEDLMQAGLAKQWNGEIYAFFRDRLIVPIRDQLGNVIAFWARALQEWQEPKYLNSSESMIYDKSNTLYGIDHLKNGVKEHKAIIVVEGYFDVIALTQAGLDIGVATCGTSLTANHMTTLKRYDDHVYFLFDNDSAGINATLRWLAIAYAQNLYPKVINLTPTPLLTERGSRPLESSRDSDGHPSLSGEGTRMRSMGWGVVVFKDIDELVRDNPDAQVQVKNLMNEAKDGFVWALDHYMTQYDIASPVERQKILHGLFDLVYAVESLSTQNLFLDQMSHMFHMDYTLTAAQYRQYIRTEKKLFWPRKWSQLEEKEWVKQSRIDQKLLILWALLYDNFWMTLQIDAVWIDTIQQFLRVISHTWSPIIPLDETGNIIIDWSPLAPLDKGGIAERQIRREKEIANLWDTTGDKNTAFAKQVIVPHLHTLQKNALKHLSAEDKQQLLQLSAKLR